MSFLDPHSIIRLGLQVVLFHWMPCLGIAEKNGSRSHFQRRVTAFVYVPNVTCPVLIAWLQPLTLSFYPKRVRLAWASLSLTADPRIWCLNGLQKAPSAICSSFLFAAHPSTAGCKQQQMIAFSFVFSWDWELHPNDLQGGWHFQLNSAQSDRHNFSRETVRSCLLPKCYTDNDYNSWFNSSVGCPFIWSGFIPGFVHREAPFDLVSTSCWSPSSIWPLGGRRLTEWEEPFVFILYSYKRLE